MKHNVFFLVLSFWFVTACHEADTNHSVSLSQEQHNSAYETWENIDDDQYIMKYPAGWVLDKSGTMGASFFLFAPTTDTPTQGFRPNINLIIQDLGLNKVSLEEYVRISEQQVSTFFTNGRVLKKKPVSSTVTPGFSMLYTGEQGMYKLKFLNYFWIKNQKAYVLTYTNTEDNFDQFSKVIHAMFGTFTIK